MVMAGDSYEIWAKQIISIISATVSVPNGNLCCGLFPSLPYIGTFLAGPLDPMDRHGRGLARDIGVLRTMLLHCQLKLCGFVQQDGKWQAGAASGGTILDWDLLIC